MRRGDKEFQELVDEMVADILQRDMDAAGQKARRKAEDEHKASAEKIVNYYSWVLGQHIVLLIIYWQCGHTAWRSMLSQHNYTAYLYWLREPDD